MPVEVFDSGEALARAAAGFIAARAAAAAKRSGCFILVLSGGRTPLAAYRRLGADKPFPWAACQLFWGDERCVPADHPDSNRGAALKALGPPPGLPRENIHPIRGQLSPAEAAQDYEWRLKGFFAPTARPSWDLLLLGLGGDGHVASLFPGSPALDEGQSWVAAVPAPTHVLPHLPRVTLTLWAINRAREVLFLVAGASKGPVVRRILDDPLGAAEFPAARVQPAGQVHWFLDREAAGD